MEWEQGISYLKKNSLNETRTSINLLMSLNLLGSINSHCSLWATNVILFWCKLIPRTELEILFIVNHVTTKQVMWWCVFLTSQGGGIRDLPFLPIIIVNVSCIGHELSSSVSMHECVYACLLANPGIGAHKENDVQCVGLLLKHHDTLRLFGQIKHSSVYNIWYYSIETTAACNVWVNYTWHELLYL